LPNYIDQIFTFKEIIDDQRVRKIYRLVITLLVFGGRKFFAGLVSLLQVDLKINPRSLDVFAGKINLDLLPFLL
jgi:hypothetical protein